MVRRLRNYHHKRRIRKKWKIGEFTEWGVKAHGFFPNRNEDDFFDSMVTWLEARGLGMVGLIYLNEFDLIISVFDARRPIQSITQEEIELLPQAFAGAGAESMTVGPKIDLNG